MTGLGWWDFTWEDCPDRANHRNPQGPNEDTGQCGHCGMITFWPRPEGESFGWHLADCSLPIRHPGYCQPGGAGHEIPEGEVIRG